MGMTVEKNSPPSGDPARTEAKDTLGGLFQADVSGQLLTANLALARMLGYPSPAALIAVSSDFGELLFSDPERRSGFRRVLEERGAVQDFEIPVEHRGDGVRWLSLNARGFRGSDGKLLLYAGTSQDIT